MGIEAFAVIVIGLLVAGGAIWMYYTSAVSRPCPHCGAMMSKKAIKCPHCRKSVPLGY